MKGYLQVYNLIDNAKDLEALMIHLYGEDIGYLQNLRDGTITLYHGGNGYVSDLERLMVVTWDELISYFTTNIPEHELMFLLSSKLLNL